MYLKARDYSMKKQVLVTIGWINECEKFQKKLKENTNYQFTFKKEAEITDEDFDKTQIIIGNLKPEILKNFKSLEWVQLASSGANQYAVPGVLPVNTLLSSATGTYGLVISEYLIGATLVMQRKFDRYFTNQQNKLWNNEGSIQSIYGSTFLIVGLGDIGTEFAKRIKALGGYTIGVKRKIYGDEQYVDELYTTDELDKQLPRADVVVSILPSTPATTNLYDKDRFLKMKESAIFINVGRGTAVVQDDLCDILDEGKIAGAVLDVTEPEPLPEDHRLWQTPNVFITPHISGNYALPATKDIFIDLANQNLRRYHEKKKLQSEVDFNTGYRKK